MNPEQFPSLGEENIFLRKETQRLAEKCNFLMKQLLSDKTRYRLTSDDDGHDFIIPADKLEEWNKYLDLTYNKGQYPDEPKWATQVNPSRISFENWREE